MNVKKAIEISDAKIQFVSLVDKAANKKRFLITKAENDSAVFETYGKIIKVDNNTHYITGVVYAPMEEDAHGNYMTMEEIQKAAYWFAKNGDQVDLQHSFEAVDGVSVVENYIAPCDMEVGDSTIAKGTWIITAEVTNTDVWGAVEKGEITGFSMGGMGKYSEEDVALEDIKKDDSTQKKGLFKKLGEMLGFDVVEKGTVKDTYNERAKWSTFWDAFYVLEDILCTYNEFTGQCELETDEESIRTALSEFSAIVTDILTEKNIAKALSDSAPKQNEGVNEEEETEVTKQEIQGMIDESIQKALEAKAPEEKPAEEVKKKETTQEEAPAQLTAEDIQNIVAKAVEPLLQASGVPSNLNDDLVQKADNEQHYMHGIL